MPLLPPGGLGPLNDPHFTITPQIIVDNSDTGETVDLSSRLVGFTIGASVDQACAQATFTFARSSGADSLSPLIAGSAYRFSNRPMLDPNLEPVLNLTISGTPIGTIWFGRIDRVNLAAGPGLVTIQCRDAGAYVLNRSIQAAAMYGSIGGIDMETVMRSILADNGLGAFTIDVPVSPGFAVQSFPVTEMGVLEQLRIMAQWIGWDIRNFPNSTGILTLYDPQRARVDVDAVIGPTRYESITELSYGDEDVRNKWRGYYQDASDVFQGPIEVEDTASIALYGERYAQIYLHRAEGIRTEAAMTNFLNAALADTKDPFASHSVRMPFYPTVLLNDIHTYQANGDEYDRDQTFAVVGYTHEYKGGHGTTTIQARGKPLAAYRDYRRSIPRKVLVSTVAPDPGLYAPEGTLYLVTDSLLPP